MEIVSGDKTDVLDVSDSDYDTDVDDESTFVLLDMYKPTDVCVVINCNRTCI